jgi:molecular chaperone DnaK (HSP70)
MRAAKHLSVELGACRAQVQEILAELFPGVELCRRINPDEAVVLGAALEASRSVDMQDVRNRAVHTRCARRTRH